MSTNADAGTTPLHPDHRAQLIPSLATRDELNQFERLNILEGQRWALSPRVLRSRSPLDEIYLRELHERMFRRTWKWAGKYRMNDFYNLGCPVAEIRERVGVLIGDASCWLEHKTFGIDEIALRFHHRLVFQIHGFPDGNGRHARLLADVIAVKYGAERFTWGGGNLRNENPARAAYLAALKVLDADDRNIQPLLQFARSENA
jgi:Fic-DOC domain mobile mystery protein B